MSEKLSITYLDGYTFVISGRRVAFQKIVRGNRRNYVAMLSFDDVGDANGFVSLLKSANIKADLSERFVKLDTESFIGLLIYIDATPPGFVHLYASPNLHVFAEADGPKLYFYFAVVHNGVWRTLKGMYGASRVGLWAKECDLAEKLWNEATNALYALGMPTNALPPMKRYGGRCHISLNVPHLSRFLQYAAERVEAGETKVSLEGNLLRIRAGNVEAGFEFELAKGGVVKYIAVELPKALKLYKALKALGIPAELAPEGVRLGGKAVWALLSLAVEEVKTVAEVLPGVLLANKYDIDGRKMPVFVYTYNYDIVVRFVLEDGGWKSAGGRLYKNRIYLLGNVAEIAEAINTLYIKRDLSRRVVVNGNVLTLSLRDLTFLGLKSIVIRLALERAKKYVAYEDAIFSPPISPHANDKAFIIRSAE